MEILTLSYPRQNIKNMKQMVYFLPILVFSAIGMFIYMLILTEKENEFIFFPIGLGLIVGIVCIIYWIEYVAMLNTRIMVDKNGIYYKADIPKWMCFLSYHGKEWSVRWEDLNDKIIRLGRTEQSKMLMLGPLTMGFKYNINGESTMIYPLSMG